MMVTAGKQVPPSPTGPIPLPDNFDPNVNPLGVGLFAGCLVTLVFAVVSTIGRLWSRKSKKQRLLWSDASILVALVCSVGLMVIMGLLVRQGQGRHVNDLATHMGPEGFLIVATNISKIAPPLSDLWVVAVTCVRISILQLYTTVFEGVRWFKYTCIGVGLVQLAGMVTVLTLVNVYTPQDPQAVVQYIVVQSLFLALDLSIAILPVPLVWRLQMRTRTKVGVTALFAIGACVCACSAIRLAWVKDIHNPDFTYQLTMPYFFSLMEPFLGITLANLPQNQPLLKSLSETLAESRTWQKVKSSIGLGSRSTFSSRRSPPGTSQRSGKGKPVEDEESIIELRGDFANTEVDAFSERSLGHKDPPSNHIGVTRSWLVS